MARLTATIEEHKLAEATAAVNTQATTKTARGTGVQTRHDEDGTLGYKGSSGKAGAGGGTVSA